MVRIPRLLSIVAGCTATAVFCSVAQAGTVAVAPLAGMEAEDIKAESTKAENIESISETRRSNICFGGLEDGKLIPNDDRVENPFTQTSLLGCSVEGGQPVYLPDLKPAIPNGVLA